MSLKHSHLQKRGQSRVDFKCLDKSYSVSLPFAGLQSYCQFLVVDTVINLFGYMFCC